MSNKNDAQIIIPSISDSIFDLFNLDWLGDFEDNQFKLNRENFGFKQNGFPKYNIFKTDNGFGIELALAGYNKSQLKVSEINGYIFVDGQKDTTKDKKYLVKNITEQSFQWKFKLPEHTKITGVKFVDGMLTITLLKEQVSQEGNVYEID